MHQVGDLNCSFSLKVPWHFGLQSTSSSSSSSSSTTTSSSSSSSTSFNHGSLKNRFWQDKVSVCAFPTWHKLENVLIFHSQGQITTKLQSAQWISWISYERPRFSAPSHWELQPAVPPEKKSSNGIDEFPSHNSSRVGGFHVKKYGHMGVKLDHLPRSGCKIFEQKT